MPTQKPSFLWVALAMAGLASSAGFLIFLLRDSWSGPTLDRAKLAYSQGNLESAASDAAELLERNPDDEPAMRLRLRALSKLDRAREAAIVAARMGGARLEGEDLLLFGQALIKTEQPALGWAALDAASKLDPKNPEIAEALTTRSRKAARGANGDKLSAVPTGPALAELVVGLASLGAGPAVGRPSSLVDNVLRHDRATLLKVDSPFAARKLLTRVLLEEGRAVEALNRLGKAEDPEGQWLLGRAELVQGNVDRAKSATALAGAFGSDDPAALEPSVYVGAKQCAACHAEIYDTQQSSRHAGTIAWGEGLKRVPLPADSVVDPGNPAVTHQFTREGERIELTTTILEKDVKAVIDYALGSGHHGMTMLAKEKKGGHRSLRISYYAGGNHWGLTNSLEARPTDTAGYIGEELSDESFRGCLNCHTTRFLSDQDRTGPEVLDHGIGCERCHGPGDNHIRAVESNFPQLAIARPKDATPARRLKLCAQCHASSGKIPPADPQFIRFQATTLLFSRCVSESGGRLDCVACHNPHTNVETSPAYYEARCLACHQGQVKGASKAPTPSMRLEAVSAAVCPVQPSKDCLNCHMPKVEKIMPFTAFTDHHIRVRRPEAKPVTPGGPR